MVQKTKSKGAKSGSNYRRNFYSRKNYCQPEKVTPEDSELEIKVRKPTLEDRDSYGCPYKPGEYITTINFPNLETCVLSVHDGDRNLLDGDRNSGEGAKNLKARIIGEKGETYIVEIASDLKNQDIIFTKRYII